MTEQKLIILVNDRVKMSRGKYAAQAVHAALLALGVHPEVPVIVLGGAPSEIAGMKTTVHDAGRTEVEPGTLTAGTDWDNTLRCCEHGILWKEMPYSHWMDHKVDHP